MAPHSTQKVLMSLVAVVAACVSVQVRVTPVTLPDLLSGICEDPQIQTKPQHTGQKAGMWGCRKEPLLEAKLKMGEQRLFWGLARQERGRAAREKGRLQEGPGPGPERLEDPVPFLHTP